MENDAFDWIWNLLPEDSELLREMIVSGVIFTPECPLIISHISDPASVVDRQWHPAATRIK